MNREPIRGMEPAILSAQSSGMSCIQLPDCWALHKWIKGDALVIDRNRGEEGLVFLTDRERHSSGPKFDFALPDAGQLMTAEARA